MFAYILNKKQNGGQPQRIPVINPLDNIMLFYVFLDTLNM